MEPSLSISSSESVKQIHRIRVPVVAAIICLFAVLATVVPSATVAIQTCDTALDDTRKTNDDGLAKCFEAAHVSVDKNTRALLGLGSASIAASVDDFLEIGTTGQRLLSNAINKVTHPDPRIWDWTKELAPTIWLSTKTFASKGLSTTAVSVYDYEQNTLTHLANFAQQSLVVEINGTLENNLALLGTTTSGSGVVDVPLRYLTAEERVMKINDTVMLLEGYISIGNSQWSHVVPITTVAGMYYNSVVKITPQYAITTQVSVSLEKVSEFLRQLAEATKSNSGIDIAIYTIVAESPVGDFFGNDYAETRGQQGILTGVSSGDSYLSVNGTNLIDGSAVLLKDIQATDNTIREIAEGIHSLDTSTETGYEIVFNSNSTYRFSGYVIYVHRINTSTGINWWLAAAEYDNATNDVSKAKDQTLAQVETEDRDISNEMSRDRIITIVVVLCLAVFVLVLSAFMLKVIFKPLLSLEQDMAKVAQFDLKEDVFDGGNNESLFYEISNMQDSFQQMVKNLREYRAYVPDAVIDGDNFNSVPPPQGEITCVFTDIVKSASLWEQSPEDMMTAMTQHDTLIRSCVAQYSGYEVKTIGDAFMVAFTDPKDAFLFCHEVQTRLLQARWPSGLLLPRVKLPDSDKFLWNGLQLRIGLTRGEANLEESPMTGRADYRGSTINTAARLEASAMPGTVCCTEDFKQLIESQVKDRIVFHNHGIRPLKGIGDKSLFVSVPKDLEGRFSGVTESVQLISTTPSSVTVRVRNKNSKTKLSLSKGMMSVASVKLPGTTSDPNTYSLAVAVALDSAAVTDGVVVFVAGNSIGVNWSSAVKLHTIAAIRFSADVYSKGGKKSGLVIGITTEECHYGNVGTKNQRFSTIFGRCFLITDAACDLAKSLGGFCIVADRLKGSNLLETCSVVAPYLRIADVWQDIESRENVTFYDVMSGKLGNVLSAIDDNDDGLELNSSSDLNECYLSLLHSRDKDAIKKLTLHVATNPSDVVYENILSRLLSSTVTGTTYRRQVQFSHLKNE